MTEHDHRFVGGFFINQSSTEKSVPFHVKIAILCHVYINNSNKVVRIRAAEESAVRQSTLCVHYIQLILFS